MMSLIFRPSSSSSSLQIPCPVSSCPNGKSLSILKMGRQRLPIRPIEDPKARHSTFIKRRAGLKKKVSEFSVLCGVDVCMICIGPQDDRKYQPEIWPKEMSEVDRIINRYRNISVEEKEKRKYNLARYLEERRQKLENELDQRNKENALLAYPLWDDRLNEWSEEALRNLVATLDSRLELVRQRIQSLMISGRVEEKELAIMPIRPFDTNAVDFQLPDLPVSCFEPLDPLQMGVEAPFAPTTVAPLADDFGSIPGYSDFSDYVPIPPFYNKRFEAFGGQASSRNVFEENEFKDVRLLNDSRLFQQPSIYGPSSSSPRPNWSRIPHGLVPGAAYHLNRGMSEMNGIKMLHNRELETEIRKSSMTLSNGKVCYCCRKWLHEDKDIFMYRGLPFCGLQCRKHQVDMEEAMKRAEALWERGNFENFNPTGLPRNGF